MEQNFANLFGSQIRNYADRVMADLQAKLSKDCDKIDQSIVLIQLQIDTSSNEARTDTGAALDKSKLVVERANALLNEYKQLKIQKCSSSNSIWSISRNTPTGISKKPNYLLWGGIAVAAAVIIGGAFIIIRRK